MIDELIALLEKISKDAETIRTNMETLDNTYHVKLAEIRAKMTEIENSYRKIALELLRMKNG